MIDVIDDGPADAPYRLLLAHGAGAPMTSPFMTGIAARLARHGLAVSRFEFAYMATRRAEGKRRPPPKAERLIDEYTAAVETVVARRTKPQSVFIGGKSMGGRVASLVADDLFRQGRVAGLVCLGYPFHAPAKPDAWRTAHLENLLCPALIVQGERDPFGGRAEVTARRLSERIQFCWAADGDHDLAPRAKSGATHDGNLDAAAAAIRDFVQRV